MKIRVIAVVVAMVVVVSAGVAWQRSRDTAPPKPTRADIDITVFLAPRGAKQASERFLEAESYKYIDTGSFSRGTSLSRAYELAAPMRRAEFWRWVETTYPPPNWELASTHDGVLADGSKSGSGGSAQYRRLNYKGFNHYLDVQNQYNRSDELAGIVRTFDVTYTIG